MDDEKKELTDGIIPIPEQEDVINTTGVNMIVSASAGSGKTSVMIRKIFGYISGGKCNVDDLLVLTYTKSAAQEMKKKLVDKIKESSDENMQGQLERIQQADISTFDSFCQRLAKKYFYVLGIDPAFGVLEGGDKMYAQMLSMDGAIRKMKNENPAEFEALLCSLSPDRNENEIRNIVLKIYDYQTSLLDFNEFQKITKNLYKKDEKIAENYTISCIQQKVRGFKDIAQSLWEKCNNLGYASYLKYLANIMSICDGILCLSELGKIINYIPEINYSKLDKDKHDEALIFHSQIAELKTQLKKYLDGTIVSFGTSDEIEKSYESCAGLVDSLFKVLEFFIEKYGEYKAGAGLYDFDDIERFTIRLLENQQIRAELKKKYKYIFVDEFQDANAVQEKIIFLLENDNLFFVGDTKQSIYNFRQSDPQIFLDLVKKFGEDGGGKAKELNCNFRTNANILEFANNIFSVIMTKDTSGIDYAGTAKFNPKARYDDIDGEVNVSLDLLISDAEDEEKLQPTGVYDIKQNMNKDAAKGRFDDECKYICSKIALLLGEPIYDKDEKRVRGAELDDITILIDKRGAFLNTLMKYFQEYKIPYIVNSNEALEEQKDNLVLYNLLKIAINSKDDYALYSVMSSPLFDFSDEELALIRKYGEGESFSDAVKSVGAGDFELSQKVRDFYAFLEKFLFDLKYKGIYYSLGKIIKDSKYLLKIASEDDFLNREINIKAYIDSFAGTKFDFDVCEYISRRDVSTRENKIESVKPKLRAITITTMHSSKGLEYPIVILPNLDQNYKKKGFKIGGGDVRDIVISKDLGVGIKAYSEDDRTVKAGIFYTATKLLEESKEQSEKIRLLYVAMTRAKSKLVLIGKNNKKFKNLASGFDIMEQNNFLSLIVGSLDGGVISKINSGAEFSQSLFDNDKLKLNSIIVEDESKIPDQVQSIHKQDEENIIKLSTFLKKDNKGKWSKVALKNSVSGFAFAGDECITLAPKMLTKNEHLVETSSDMGTLYHKLLECIDFSQVRREDDVLEFINCNFDGEQRQTLVNFGVNNIYRNISILNALINTGDRTLKEQKFVMRAKHSEIISGGEDEQILVQGIIDLLIIKKDEIILVDYKLTKHGDEYIKEKYRKQIEIYSLAISKMSAGKKIRAFILNLNKNGLIDMTDIRQL